MDRKNSDLNLKELSRETKIDRLSDKIEIAGEIRPRSRAGFSSGNKSSFKEKWNDFKIQTKEYKPSISNSMFKKFFIIALIFFFFSASLFFYKFFISENTTFSNDLLDFSILGSSFSPGGEDLPLTIEIVNRNPADIVSSTLFIEYPKGSDNNEDKVRLENSLGEIKSGKNLTKEINVVLFGEQNSFKNITARLEYRIKDSNAIFKKETSMNVSISEVPVSISMSLPEKSVSKQVVTLNIKTILNAEKPPKDLSLLVNYPIGFEFESSSPMPVSGNNIFDLSNIKQGQEKIITITGKLLGEAGEERTFYALVGEKDLRDSSKLLYSFNSTSKKVIIDSSVIALKLNMNGQSGKYIASSAEQVIGVVNWSNNTDKSLRDFEIKVNLSGSVYSDQNVTTASGGYFDSITDSIVWDKNSVSSFASIAPGDSGQVSFGIKAGSQIINSINPNILISVSVKAKDPSVGNFILEINNQETGEIVYNSNLQFAALARYRGGPITNSGFLPPKAEKSTTYTITWTITNTSNPVKNVVIKTRIPPYINFLNNTFPQSESLSYNASTREIIWSAGDVSAQAGISSPSREVSFQIELKPSISQIGTQPVLVFESTLNAIDRFTGAEISSKRGELTTLITNDPGFQNNEAIVSQ